MPPGNESNSLFNCARNSVGWRLRSLPTPIALWKAFWLRKQWTLQHPSQLFLFFLKRCLIYTWAGTSAGLGDLTGEWEKASLWKQPEKTLSKCLFWRLQMIKLWFWHDRGKASPALAEYAISHHSWPPSTIYTQSTFVVSGRITTDRKKRALLKNQGSYSSEEMSKALIMTTQTKPSFWQKPFSLMMQIKMTDVTDSWCSVSCS